MNVLPFLFCLYIASLSGVRGDSDTEFRIHSESDFISFASSSSGGYLGTTVYLESDLDFSGEYLNYFRQKSSFNGIFDGQGHIIRNAQIKPYGGYYYTGLFGTLSGTIKNFIMDSSCNITSAFSSSGKNHNLGSAVGRIYPENQNVLIENVVNMANIIFTGSVTGTSYGCLYFGGICGYARPNSGNITMRNCVNYGHLTHSGKVTNDAYIGGIIGYSFGSTGQCYIQNNLNYGTLTISTTETSEKRSFGGIVGNAGQTTITNCVNSAHFNIDTSLWGNIVGTVSTNTTITHCMWMCDTENNKTYRAGSPSSVSQSEEVTGNLYTVNSLNEYASKYLWNKWILNANNHSNSFSMMRNANGNHYTLSSQLILLYGSDIWWTEYTGWFTDSAYTTVFDSTEIVEPLSLYGRLDKVLVKFDVNGGDHISFTSKELTYGAPCTCFPEVSKRGHSLAGWFAVESGSGSSGSDSSNENVRVTRVYSNQTVYAGWIVNNYTVTFDFMNGTKIVNVLPFEGNITYPSDNDMTWSGYVFGGWDREIDSVPDENVTVNASWIPLHYTVTFDVNGGNDLAGEGVKEVVFGGTYGNLPTPVREGYAFDGWVAYVNGNGNVNRSVNVSCNTVVEIPDNHTLYAQWKNGILSNQVMIVFESKDMSKKEIEDFVKGFTDDYFEIIVVEENENEKEGIKIIVVFNDVDAAVSFVETVKASSDTEVIKSMGFIQEKIKSFSVLFCPLSLFLSLFV